MDQVERKKALVVKLSDYHIALNVQGLYSYPHHKKTKDWLAGVAAVLKNLDESDYQTFTNLRQRLFGCVLRTTRKPVAQEIDNFVRLKIAEYEIYDFEAHKQSNLRQKVFLKSTTPYVTKKNINGFTNKKDKFNYKKIIKLLKELNFNHTKGNQYASTMLIRAVLDHVPPLLGFNLFEEVTNSYPWSRTDKQYMKSLLDFKNNADDTLHRLISEDEDLSEIHDLPYRNRFNRLLQECLKGGGDAKFTKAKELGSKKEKEIISKIDISLAEGRSGSWQNYSISRYMGYGFKFVLDIDNFKSSKLDYVFAHLEANSKDGPWTAKHFIFETDGSDLNKPYEIGIGKQNLVTVVISDQEFSHSSHEHRFKPSVDMNTLTLCITTKSEKIFRFLIKEETLK